MSYTIHVGPLLTAGLLWACNVTLPAWQVFLIYFAVLQFGGLIGLGFQAAALRAYRLGKRSTSPEAP